MTETASKTSTSTKEGLSFEFKGKHETEELICFFRKHWITLLRYISGFLVLNIIIITLLWQIYQKNLGVITGETKYFLVAILLFLTYLIHFLFTKILNYYLAIVIVTNYRMIDFLKTILLRDDKDVIDLAEIQNIDKIQEGILPNILNFGTIKISLAGVRDVKVFYCVPRPDFYFRRINEAKRNYLLERDQERRTPDSLNHKPKIAVADTVKPQD